MEDLGALGKRQWNVALEVTYVKETFLQYQTVGLMLTNIHWNIFICDF